MVKGISRQVIVVHAPEPKLFEQAIFILKDGQQEVSDDMLLKEATKLIRMPSAQNRRINRLYGPAWAAGGALLTAIAWLITVLI